MVGGASLRRITCQLSSEGGSLRSSQTRLKKRAKHKSKPLPNLSPNQGKNIDYEGATGITFTDIGEAKGSFLELEIDNGKFKTIKQR